MISAFEVRQGPVGDRAHGISAFEVRQRLGRELRSCVRSGRSDMKERTALQQSRNSVKFLCVAVVVLLALALRYPGAYTIVPLVVIVLYVAGDAYNIYRINKRAAQDPSFLDQKIR